MINRTALSSLRSAAPIAILAVAALSATAPAAAQNTIRNEVFWKDLSSTPIYSQGGAMLKVSKHYYWYGAKYEQAVAYAQRPASAEYNSNLSP